jgi:hypothetical protein
VVAEHHFADRQQRQRVSDQPQRRGERAAALGPDESTPKFLTGLFGKYTN